MSYTKDEKGNVIYNGKTLVYTIESFESDIAYQTKIVSYVENQDLKRTLIMQP